MPTDDHLFSWVLASCLFLPFSAGFLENQIRREQMKEQTLPNILAKQSFHILSNTGKSLLAILHLQYASFRETVLNGIFMLLFGSLYL